MPLESVKISKFPTWLAPQASALNAVEFSAIRLGVRIDEEVKHTTTSRPRITRSSNKQVATSLPEKLHPYLRAAHERITLPFAASPFQKLCAFLLAQGKTYTAIAETTECPQSFINWQIRLLHRAARDECTSPLHLTSDIIRLFAHHNPDFAVTPKSLDELRTHYSAHEMAVIQGVVAGQSNKAISEDLNVSETAVKMTLASLFEQSGVDNRYELTALHHNVGVPYMARSPVFTEETQQACDAAAEKVTLPFSATPFQKLCAFLLVQGEDVSRMSDALAVPHNVLRHNINILLSGAGSGTFAREELDKESIIKFAHIFARYNPTLVLASEHIKPYDTDDVRIIHGIVDGKSHKDIAHELKIAHQTVAQRTATILAREDLSDPLLLALRYRNVFVPGRPLLGILRMEKHPTV